MSESDRRERAKKIIRNAAIAASTAAGAVAFGAIVRLDYIFLIPIVANMVIQIGILFGKVVDNETAKRFTASFLKVALGLYLAKSLLGFFPVFGSVINGVATYSFIQLIGWTIYEMFNNNEEISDIKEREVKEYLNKVSRERKDR